MTAKGNLKNDNIRFSLLQDLRVTQTILSALPRLVHAGRIACTTTRWLRYRILARSSSDFSTFSASKTSRASSRAARECKA